MPQRKTLVLDLDETLIHSRHMRTASSISCDLQLEVEIEKTMCRFYVHHRPYAELFLQTVRSVCMPGCADHALWLTLGSR